MKAKHPVLEKIIERISSTFQGNDRIELGPNLISDVILNHYNVTWEQVQSLDASDLKVLPTHSFYPFNAGGIYELCENRTDEQWRDKFSNSYMVHFYGFQTAAFKISNNKANTAYRYLGPRYCPETFRNSADF